ncbi:glycosyltransferase family 2 protein [Rahnella woolbedingensis]|uniref:Glycosyltransferase family 2 protein n=1 Tax=Rahnella woolbedingensis TaxID=1510574 RepID=A0A419NE36_9GAMM|nr:glycosyltransferase family 2 protein [Rahnella woolbedingensis]RJT47023.1 glycosyltransferase family 2 protein [Rahnella woolbedingensis]
MVYIIVVSHGHDNFIKKLFSGLNLTSSFYKVIVKDNLNNKELQKYCNGLESVEYISSNMQYGFGKNNNIAAKYAIEILHANNSDYFLILNPDIYITDDVLVGFIQYNIRHDIPFSTLCLYKNFEKTEHYYSIRNFPNLIDFASSFLLGINKTKYIKEDISEEIEVDWCAGSFMLIKVAQYRSIKGFDEGYFMYCEDIDISYRLSLSGSRLRYIPHFDAIHYAHHDNRNFLSQAFRWHLKSIGRYLLRKIFLTKNNFSRIKSSL